MSQGGWSRSRIHLTFLTWVACTLQLQPRNMTSAGAARFASAATKWSEVGEVEVGGAPGVPATLGSNFSPVAEVSLQSAASRHQAELTYILTLLTFPRLSPANLETLDLSARLAVWRWMTLIHLISSWHSCTLSSPPLSSTSTPTTASFTRLDCSKWSRPEHRKQPRRLSYTENPSSSNVFTQSATYFIRAGRAGGEDRSAGSRNPEAWVVGRVVGACQGASKTSSHGGSAFPPLVGRFLSAIDSLSLKKAKSMIDFLH